MSAASARLPRHAASGRALDPAALSTVGPAAGEDGAAADELAGGVALSLRGAGIRLGARWIWRDVDLTVEQGEFVAVLGPNGAGKSTLLKAILGLLPLSTGTLEVLERPATRGNRAIGYLPQRRSFDPDLRIRGRDLVRLGFDGARWGVPLPGLGRIGAAARDRVDEVIELVGASAYARRPVGELSGGEQQRLLIAQALVAGPSILLLDEPLDSLDISNQQSISALVQDICRTQGVAVLLVAHDVNPIISYLDRVIYVANAQTAIGAPEDVITSETLSLLYGSPIDVLRSRDGRLVVVGQPDTTSFHATH
jgi:zinc/manganese transport system ATP-binding protein